MFGLFGKSDFSAEMAALDREDKALGAELMKAMNSIDLDRQAQVLRAMADLIERKIECCRRHGKHGDIPMLEGAKDQALRMLGQQ